MTKSSRSPRHTSLLRRFLVVGALDDVGEEHVDRFWLKVVPKPGVTRGAVDITYRRKKVPCYRRPAADALARYPRTASLSGSSESASPKNAAAAARLPDSSSSSPRLA